MNEKLLKAIYNLTEMGSSNFSYVIWMMVVWGYVVIMSQELQRMALAGTYTYYAEFAFWLGAFALIWVGFSRLLYPLFHDMMIEEAKKKEAEDEE